MRSIRHSVSDHSVIYDDSDYAGPEISHIF